jgi:hypothetical protein
MSLLYVEKFQKGRRIDPLNYRPQTNPYQAQTWDEYNNRLQAYNDSNTRHVQAVEDFKTTRNQIQNNINNYSIWDYDRWKSPIFAQIAAAGYEPENRGDKIILKDEQGILIGSGDDLWNKIPSRLNQLHGGRLIGTHIHSPYFSSLWEDYEQASSDKERELISDKIYNQQKKEYFYLQDEIPANPIQPILPPSNPKNWAGSYTYGGNTYRKVNGKWQKEINGKFVELKTDVAKRSAFLDKNAKPIDSVDLKSNNTGVSLKKTLVSIEPPKKTSFEYEKKKYDLELAIYKMQQERLAKLKQIKPDDYNGALKWKLEEKKLEDLFKDYKNLTGTLPPSTSRYDHPLITNGKKSIKFNLGLISKPKPIIPDKMEMRPMVKKPDFRPIIEKTGSLKDYYTPLMTSPRMQTVLVFNPKTGRHQVKEVRTQKDAFFKDSDGWQDVSEPILYYNPETGEESTKPNYYGSYKFNKGGILYNKK